MDTPTSQAPSSSSLRNDPRTPTPRRKPHCKSCGSPMLGHKRGLCQTPVKNYSVTPLAESRAPVKIEAMDLSSAFRKLQLNDPADGKARRQSSTLPQKAATLVSLATGEKDELDALVRPGIMTDVVAEEDENSAKANIQKWLQDLPSSNSPSARKRSTPRPSATFSSPDALDLLRDRTNTVRTPRKSVVDTAKPVGRTSTTDEREAFFTTLSEKSKKPVASVFTIDMQDIQELAMNAKRLKLYARVIAPKYSDGTTG